MNKILLTKFDLGWLVAFLEGEGYFGVNGNGRGNSSSLVVKASQVQRWPLERLLALVGGSIVRSHAATDTQQECLEWRVFGQMAWDVSVVVYPHMSPRRQLQIASAIWKAGRPRHTGFCARGHCQDIHGGVRRDLREPTGTARFCRACDKAASGLRLVQCA